MPPTTKKLLESLSGALMSVLVGVDIASNTLVHLLSESARDLPEELLNTLLRCSDDHINHRLHKILVIHSLHSNIVSANSSNKSSHLFLFIKLFFSFIRFLIISCPLIILIFFEIKVKPILPISPSKIVLIVLLLIPITIIIGAATITAVSSTIKHSLLLLIHLSLPLGIRGSMIRFSSVSLCSRTFFTPVFDNLHLKRCVPCVPTSLACDSEAFCDLVKGDFSTIFNGYVLSTLVDFVTIVAHPGASLNLVYDQSACSACLSFSALIIVLLVSLSLSLIVFCLIFLVLCHLFYFGFICLFIRISTGSILILGGCLISDGNNISVSFAIIIYILMVYIKYLLWLFLRVIIKVASKVLSC